MGSEVVEEQLRKDPERGEKRRTLRGRWCTAEAVAAKAFEALAQRVIEWRGDSSGGGGSERGRGAGAGAGVVLGLGFE